MLYFPWPHCQVDLIVRLTSTDHDIIYMTSIDLDIIGSFTSTDHDHDMIVRLSSLDFDIIVRSFSLDRDIIVRLTCTDLDCQLDRECLRGDVVGAVVLLQKLTDSLDK